MLSDVLEIQNSDQFARDDSLIIAHGDSAVLKDLLICEALAQALQLSLSGLCVYTKPGLIVPECDSWCRECIHIPAI